MAPRLPERLVHADVAWVRQLPWILLRRGGALHSSQSRRGAEPLRPGQLQRCWWRGAAVQRQRRPAAGRLDVLRLALRQRINPPDRTPPRRGVRFRVRHQYPRRRRWWQQRQRWREGAGAAPALYVHSLEQCARAMRSAAHVHRTAAGQDQPHRLRRHDASPGRLHACCGGHPQIAGDVVKLSLDLHHWCAHLNHLARRPHVATSKPTRSNAAIPHPGCPVQTMVAI